MAELYAAREKNGIYIPGEQYLADEVKKKILYSLCYLYLYTRL